MNNTPAACEPGGTPRRLRILLCAYACEPHLGSEPGVGWNAVRMLAQHHDLWVFTRADHRAAIERELARAPMPGVTFLYHKVPFERGTRWYRGPLIQLHYYLWQVSLWRRARPLHRRIGFDAIHHVTYVRYWTPCSGAFLGAPFLFGPVGSGEAAPHGFARDFPWRARWIERLRNLARAVAERDPLLRRSVRRAAVALATTEQTAAALRRLGARQVRLHSEVVLSDRELAELAELPLAEGKLRLVTVARLLAWKGVHLGLRAFAAAGLADAEYWVIGDGAERARLERLAGELGIADRVRFFGRLSRPEVLRALAECQVLVHPSLHDAGGWACIEAMAAGRPVLCFDWGGPGAQVTAKTGWKIVPRSPEAAVREMAAIMRRLARDRSELAAFSRECRRHVRREFSWDSRIRLLRELYDEIRQPATAG